MGHQHPPDTNQINITLYFYDFDMAPSEITEEINLTPTSIGIKGEHYTISPHNQIDRIRTQSHWEYEWELHTNEFIGDIVDKYINEIIFPRINKIASLAKASSVQFQVVQYYYTGCNPTLCIGKPFVKILAEIDASISIDIYCL